MQPRASTVEIPDTSTFLPIHCGRGDHLYLYPNALPQPDPFHSPMVIYKTEEVKPEELDPINDVIIL